MSLYLLVFTLAALVLAKASTLIISSLTKIASFFHLSQFSVSFLLMATATSLPELFVGLAAALEGSPILALGTVLGSNIANLTLIIGLSSLIAKGIRVEQRARTGDLFYMNLSALVPLVLLWDKTLSRTDGVILLIFYAFYLFRIFKEREKYTKTLDKINHLPLVLGQVGLFILGIILLLFSAEILVKTAEVLARELKIPLVLMGIFIVAVGTSLPELSFEIPTMLKRQSGMAFGNIYGSVVTNSTLILGLTALLSPIKLTYFSLFEVSAFFLALTLLLFTGFVRSQHRLSWEEGLGLIFLYLIFLWIEFSFKLQL